MVKQDFNSTALSERHTERNNRADENLNWPQNLFNILTTS